MVWNEYWPAMCGFAPFDRTAAIEEDRGGIRSTERAAACRFFFGKIDGKTYPRKKNFAIIVTVYYFI